uniref:Putative actin 3 isoform n=1 Tax=Tabanus bromius TaxID=304241 RepID=A0A0K8TTD1_TABBR
MPLFETMLREKPPIALELGTAYSKLGYAAEAYPRFIIPSEIVTEENETIKLFNLNDENELYDNLVEFLKKIFFKYLLVSPRDRKIVIVESVFCPTLIRETLARVLFRHFEVASIFFVPTHLVVLSTLAIETALVVDLGYQETTVVPVYSGIQILYAFQAQDFGGLAIHNSIKEKMLESGVKEEDLSETVIEDIKVRTCFVTTRERALQYRSGNPPQPCRSVDYPNGGKGTITIPGELRETALEVLFPEDNDNSGLAYLILDSILKCPLDMRRTLAENIFLIGGTAMIPGITARLKAELTALLESDLYKNKLFIKSIKFHKAPAKENFTAWLGGSIYSGTDLVLSRSLTKEQYCKCPRVPDWSNLDDNCVPAC